MRRNNSDFSTFHISEEGKKLSNRDYFGYVEMDDFACYVLADSLDQESAVNSARLVVESIIRDFTEAPSMRKHILKKYLYRAHKELCRHKKEMRLKVSIAVAVTDYRKLRYCHAGNTRLYLIRSARILERTYDQSLTQNRLELGEIPLDQAQAHEERNNLYSFMGDRGRPKFQFSSRKKLENGDLFILLTRGVWEQCGEEDLLNIVNDAKEVEEILCQTEDFILKGQEGREIDNYTLAVTNVGKVYQTPKKPWPVKKILMVTLPILLAAVMVSVLLYAHFRNIRTKTAAMEKYMESGEAYVGYSNFPKAAEEYGEAKKLADSLGQEEIYGEADRYGKLAEQVVLADGALEAGEYQKAGELYAAARELAVEYGNMGLHYIEGQMDRAERFMEVFDLIAQGERKEGYGNLQGAIGLYKEAKEKAAALYFTEGKKEAMELQMAAEEALDKEKMEAEKRLQERMEEEAASLAMDKEKDVTDLRNAIEMENQGNEFLATGSYDGAAAFYRAARAIYDRLGLTDLAEGIDGKIAAAEAGTAAMEAQDSQDIAWDEDE